jgi:hypothetical protein
MLASAYVSRNPLTAARLIFQAIKTSPKLFIYRVPARILRWLGGGGLTSERKQNSNASKSL